MVDLGALPHALPASYVLGQLCLLRLLLLTGYQALDGHARHELTSTLRTGFGSVCFPFLPYHLTDLLHKLMLAVAVATTLCTFLTCPTPLHLAGRVSHQVQEQHQQGL